MIVVLVVWARIKMIWLVTVVVAAVVLVIVVIVKFVMIFPPNWWLFMLSEMISPVNGRFIQIGEMISPAHGRFFQIGVSGEMDEGSSSATARRRDGIIVERHYQSVDRNIAKGAKSF